MSRHRTFRRITRTTLRRTFRCQTRSSLRGRRRGPDDLAQALTAFGRAIRAHRRLVRLAPSFFDPAVREREAFNRAEQQRWMASWEPSLARAYGVEPRPPAATNDLPPLPSVKIQQAVDLKLAEHGMCMVAGHAAMERYQQRQPHDVMSWSRMARLLKIGFEFKKLACGFDSPNPLPEKLAYDYELTDLKRGYGVGPESPEVAVPASVPVAPADSDAAVVMSHPMAPAPPAAAGGAGGCPQVTPASPPRCDAWSRWARTMHRMKS